MKKLSLFILSILCLLTITSCNESTNQKTETPNITETEKTPTPAVEQFTVTFNSNGGSTVESLKVNENTTLTKPADPTKEGYLFDGWYIDESYTLEWDFNTFVVVTNITLYAKWEEIPEVEEGPVFDDTNKLLSAENCAHKFVSNVCMVCETEYSPLIYNLFTFGCFAS